MQYSTLIIGHICRDKNTDHLGVTEYRAGGAALYSSAAAYAVGGNAAVLTKTAPADADLLTEFTLPADREKRKSACAAQGDPFTPDELPAGLEAAIYHLAGLVYGDYADGMIPFLAQRGSVAVDVQGFLRHVDRENGGAMYFADWADKEKLLPCIRYLKTDAAEAEILTGTTDRAAAARQLHAWGAEEVLITHNTEALLYADGEVLTCPLKPRSLVGRTGRGDTTFAVYLNERLTRPADDALRFAAAAVSLKMETPGPFTGTRADVEAYIDAFYK